jgi:Fic-DOC domain mobile mystery protein B
VKTLFTTGDGNTPLSPDEQVGLIPALSTKAELNEWERLNILNGYHWALRSARRPDPLTDTYIRTLHQRMFDETWSWAGTYRVTEKNIGVPAIQIRESLAVLLGNVRYWLTHQTFEPDEIAIRLHHQLVYIHPFPNGNGRHARLMADVLIDGQGRPVFTWGGPDGSDSTHIVRVGELRARYIQALRKADQNQNDIEPLLSFARS